MIGNDSLNEFPEQLQDCVFIKIKKDSKLPLGDWKKNQYSYNEIKDYDSKGIVCGNGHIVLDIDNVSFYPLIKTLVPETFIIKTPRGYHLYFESDTEQKRGFIPLKVNGTAVGEFRFHDCYVVAPNGNTHKVLEDKPISFLDDKSVKAIITLFASLTKDEKLRDLMSGEWQKYKYASRSEAESALVTKLLQIGLNDQQIKNIMPLTSIGKWSEKTEAYHEMTIQKAEKFIAQKGTDTFQDIFNREYPEVQFFVDPIIPQGVIILFGGKPSSFKSMFILLLVTSIASGKPLLEKFPVKKNTSILYYDLENGERVLHTRIKYLCKEVSPDTNFTICFDFNKKQIELEKKRAEQYDIIVLDSFRRFLKGEENSSEITDMFYKEFLKPLRDMGKTIIILHHYKKAKLEDFSDEDLQDLFRGSSDIAAQVDIVYGLLKTPEVFTDSTTSFSVSVMKAKNRLGLPLKDFVFDVLKDDKTKHTTVSFTKYGFTNPAEEMRQFIVSICKGIEVPRNVILQKVKAKFRVSDTTVVRYIQDLTYSGRITKLKHGLYTSEYSDIIDTIDTLRPLGSDHSINNVKESKVSKTSIISSSFESFSDDGGAAGWSPCPVCPAKLGFNGKTCVKCGYQEASS